MMYLVLGFRVSGNFLGATVILTGQDSPAPGFWLEPSEFILDRRSTEPSLTRHFVKVTEADQTLSLSHERMKARTGRMGITTKYNDPLLRIVFGLVYIVLHY